MLTHFLQASVPLTKSFAVTNGELVKTPYPFVWEVTSHDETTSTLTALHMALVKHAALGHCMLKGSLQRPLVNESRAGSTNASATTELLVLDLDGLPEEIESLTPSKQPITLPMTIDLFLAELGLNDISHIIQLSASHHISDKRIRAHVFMQLDKPYTAPLLKQWLIQKNHEVALLRESMMLTKTGNSIRWALDISACQNDKLIYIAPPSLKGIKDPVPKGQRIKLVKRKHDLLALTQTVNTTGKNKDLTHARINELRDVAGLPKRKFTYKVVGGTEVMLKPDEAVITDHKTERGFVYFNLNGGDSWAYYHPEDKPEHIYNFKGEPTYLTKELLPEYWEQLTSQGATRTSTAGVQYLAFLDRLTSTYWRGTYDTSSDTLDIAPAKNETIIRHFAKQHGVPIGDYVPEWDLTFDPNDNVRVDLANKVINTFQPSTYMTTPAKKVTKCPPTIFRVMHHALGEDVDITEHFINWVAFILQERTRTCTAWVLHGTQGTGKGVLTNNILRPLFGKHTTSRRMEELVEKYNGFMQDSLLVFVDEVQLKALGNEKGIMAKIKNFITEEIVPIRAMYAGAVDTVNRTNWIFCSNMADPVQIDRNDRRFNTGRYQQHKLTITSAEIQQIERELQAFHDYLLGYAVSQDKAREIIHNVDRDHMISLTESSIDTVSNAMLTGDADFFFEQLPTDSGMRNALRQAEIDEYTLLLRSLAIRTSAQGRCNIAREELRTLFNYIVGNIPSSPNKFTSLLKHHRIHMSAVWVGNKTVRGVTVQWSDMSHFLKLVNEHLVSS